MQWTTPKTSQELFDNRSSEFENSISKMFFLLTCELHIQLQKNSSQQYLYLKLIFQVPCHAECNSPPQTRHEMWWSTSTCLFVNHGVKKEAVRTICTTSSLQESFYPPVNVKHCTVLPYYIFFPYYNRPSLMSAVNCETVQNCTRTKVAPPTESNFKNQQKKYMEKK